MVAYRYGATKEAENGERAGQGLLILGSPLAVADLAATAGHPFYEKLNDALRAMGFNPGVEEACAKFYHDKLGRPGIPPGVYFRMLMIGYFAGIDSERGIA